MPPRAWLAAVEAEGDPEDELVRLKTLSDVGRDCQGTTKRRNGCPAWAALTDRVVEFSGSILVKRREAALLT